MATTHHAHVDAEPLRIRVNGVVLVGDLALPDEPRGIILFAHGSGSSRLSPRNRYVAKVLNDSGLATLLFDLPTIGKEQIDQFTGQFRFGVAFLARRLVAVTDWMRADAALRARPVGYFGASTGGGAALPAVRAPTLLIVGGHDAAIIKMNRAPMRQMSGDVRLEIVPPATHLFEEPGALEQVARLVRTWFLTRMPWPEGGGTDGRCAPTRGARSTMKQQE